MQDFFLHQKGVLQANLGKKKSEMKILFLKKGVGAGYFIVII